MQQPSNTKYVLGVVLPENTLVEEIIDEQTRKPVFLISRSNEVKIGNEKLADDGTRYEPMDNSYIREGIIPLPFLSSLEDIQKYALPTLELHKKIMAYIHKYVDVDEPDRYIVAAYVIHTWVYDRYDKVPYLRFIGSPGSGKSRALRVLHGICYHSLLLTGNISDAGIFRSLELNSHGTMLFDEMNLYQSSRTSGIVKVLNAGTEKASNIARCEGTNYSPRLHGSFCPKVLSQNQLFTDPALESRLLSVHMRPTNREDIYDQLSSYDHQQEVIELQKHLLAFRINQFSNIDVFRKYPEMEIYPHRFRERYSPILRTLDIATVPDEIQNFIKKDHQAYSDAFAISSEGFVISALTEKIDQGVSQVYPGEIAALVSRYGQDLSAREVGSIFSVLGLKRLNRDYHGFPYSLKDVTTENLRRYSGF